MPFQNPSVFWGILILFTAVSLWSVIAYIRVTRRLERFLRQTKTAPPAPHGPDTAADS